jgi:GTP diphosphokinase / guanosine-3',5'-bis(diphosphate) 3'-diphosphatase
MKMKELNFEHEKNVIINEAKKYLPNLNVDKFNEAFEFARAAHADQFRFSGEPYFIHPIAATKILLNLKSDQDTIIACLLHDVVEDTKIDLKTIEKKFGKTVARLCSGMEKLGTVQFSGKERQIENLRKMFVAMATDLRVIFIKLADRIHNLQTLKHLKPEKQKRIAYESLEIYAPIAARLGIYEFKSKLEDLSFQFIEPIEYQKIKYELTGTSKNREKFIQIAIKKLQQIFQQQKALKLQTFEEFEILGRTKHFYSIWRKIQLKKFNNVTEIYDLFALRVLTNTTADCYAALGIIHAAFTPLSRRFKDFIAAPKPNGYQSLHTTVMGLIHEQPVEIQIRTRQMHAEAEFGAAAHWQYSEKKQSVIASSEKLHWIRGLLEIHKQLKDNTEFVQSLTRDVFEDRIFVLTPQGDIFDLPAGATPVDFAYTVHTEIGHRCAGAKVNGKIAPLDCRLKNGQVVEILTKKESKPNRFWLGFVKTNSASNKIKTFFASLDHSENFAAGKDLLNKKLVRLGKPPLDSEYSLLKNYKKQNLSKKKRGNLIERIGNGSVHSGAVLRDLFEFTELTEKREIKPVAILQSPNLDKEVIIEGVAGIATQLAKCCAPKLNDEVTAVLSRAGAKIHKKNCQQIKRVATERKLTAYFASNAPVLQLVCIAVNGDNRVGFLRDIASVVAGLKINIADLSLKKSDKYTILHELTLEISDLEKLEKVLAQLEKIDGVREVRKL